MRNAFKMLHKPWSERKTFLPAKRIRKRFEEVKQLSYFKIDRLGYSEKKKGGIIFQEGRQKL